MIDAKRGIKTSTSSYKKILISNFYEKNTQYN